MKATLKNIDDAVHNMENADAKINAMTQAQKDTARAIGIKDQLNGLYGNSTWLAFKQMMKASDTDGA